MLAKKIDFSNAIERYLNDFVNEMRSEGMGGGFGGAVVTSKPLMSLSGKINRPNTVSDMAHAWICFGHSHRAGLLAPSQLKRYSVDMEGEHRPEVDAAALITGTIHATQKAKKPLAFERALKFFGGDQRKFNYFMLLCVTSKRYNREFSKYRIAEICEFGRNDLRAGRPIGVVYEIIQGVIHDWEQEPYDFYEGR